MATFTMPRFKPYIESARELHARDVWEKKEAYRYYAMIRIASCRAEERLDLWLRAPLCDGCAFSDPWPPTGPADIGGTSWRDDVAWKLGEETAEEIDRALADDSDFCLRCRRCASELRPWDGDAVYVESIHLEERYRIPISTEGKVEVGRRLRRTILEVYGDRCFNCGSQEDLHLDHIVPRAAGGDAAFRNLQPLCETCGQEKGKRVGEDISVYDDIYFLGPPSNGYLGLL